MLYVTRCLVVFLCASSALAQDRPEGITISTDRPTYRPGESIRFTYRLGDAVNPARKVHSSLYPILRRAGETPVIHVWSSPWPLTEQGSGFTFTWDGLIGGSQDPLPSGTYEFSERFRYADAHGIDDEATVRVRFDVVAATPNAGGRVVVRVARTVYRRGEPVRFTLVNRTKHSLTLTRSAPYEVRNETDGSVVFSPVSLMVVGELRAGRSRSWTWNGRGNDGQQVGVGVYRTELSFLDYAGRSRRRSATFRIR